jgi:hypothetical protein
LTTAFAFDAQGEPRQIAGSLDLSIRDHDYLFVLSREDASQVAALTVDSAGVPKTPSPYQRNVAGHHAQRLTVVVIVIGAGISLAFFVVAIGTSVFGMQHQHRNTDRHLLRLGMSRVLLGRICAQEAAMVTLPGPLLAAVLAAFLGSAFERINGGGANGAATQYIGLATAPVVAASVLAVIAFLAGSNHTHEGRADE